MADTILQVNHVSISYTDSGILRKAEPKRIVKDVSFSMERGEILGLVGESGCGKSTLSKAILGMLPYEGEITHYTKRPQMVFQNSKSSLNPAMTVWRILNEPLLIYGKYDSKERARRVKTIISDVGLPEDVTYKYPEQLSGGQRQRVGIAAAIITRPKFIVLDEPVSALDVTIQAQIFELLTELRNKMNIAIILITHDLGVVANFADRIQVMYAGQVIERGSSRDIFYDPKHPYTVALLNSVPKVSGDSKAKLYSLGGTPPDLLLPLECCPFAARCEFCMPICKKQAPLERPVSETHSAACWLMHPDAPKFDLQSMVRK